MHTDVTRFPVLERERSEIQPGSTDDRRPPPRKGDKDYGHITEMIFALPVMQVHLKTEHLQTEAYPNLTGI